jgi:hypothetical protein
MQEEQINVGEMKLSKSCRKKRAGFADKMIALAPVLGVIWVQVVSLFTFEFYKYLAKKILRIRETNMEGYLRRCSALENTSLSGKLSEYKSSIVPIDMVISWVDGMDPLHLEKKRKYSGNKNKKWTFGSMQEARFQSRDELKYLLRSIEKNLPWIRKIHLLCDRQRPKWLKTNDRLVVHDQEDFFKYKDAVPNFNSHAIEWQLHLVPGIAEHFIYCNDDFLFGQPMSPYDFFYAQSETELVPRAFVGGSWIWPFYLISRRWKSLYWFCAWNMTRALFEIANFPARLERQHHHHCSVLRKTDLMRICDLYPRAMQNTVQRRFRSFLDVVPMGMAFAHNRHEFPFAVSPDISCYFDDIKELEEWMVSGKELPALCCLNDSDFTLIGSVSEVNRVLSKAFDVPSQFEQ